MDEAVPHFTALTDLEQRELARIIGKHDSTLLDLVYGAINIRLLTDDEFAALSEALALEEDDPDEEEADRFAALLFPHCASHWSSDEPDPPLRKRLRPADKRRLIALTLSHAPDLLPVAHAVNLRWLTDPEVNALSDSLLDVFLASLDGDEPSDRGAEADKLAGLLQQHRLTFWEREPPPSPQ